MSSDIAWLPLALEIDGDLVACLGSDADSMRSLVRPMEASVNPSVAGPDAVLRRVEEVAECCVRAATLTIQLGKHGKIRHSVGSGAADMCRRQTTGVRDRNAVTDTRRVAAAVFDYFVAPYWQEDTGDTMLRMKKRRCPALVAKD